VIGDYAQEQLLIAQAYLDEAGIETDPAKQQALLDAAADIDSKWGDYGTYRLGLHTLTGFVVGDVTGGATALATAGTVPAAHDILLDMGASREVADALVLAGSAAIGNISGDVASTTNAIDQTLNNFLKHQERDDYRVELENCAADGNCDKEEIDQRYQEISDANNTELARLADVCKNTNDCTDYINLAEQGVYIDKNVVTMHGPSTSSVTGVESELGEDVLQGQLDRQLEDEVVWQEEITTPGSEKDGPGIIIPGHYVDVVEQGRNVFVFEVTAGGLVAVVPDPTDAVVGVILATKMGQKIGTVVTNGAEKFIKGFDGSLIKYSKENVNKLLTKLNVSNTKGTEGNAPNTNGTPNHNDVVMEPEADFAGNVGNLRQKNQDSLSDHMVNAGLTNRGDSIYGGHDMSNFYRQLDESGGSLTEPPVQIAPGIYDVKYKLPTTRESFTPRKTLYDPEMYPNMANLAEAAGHKALTQFKLTGKAPETTTVGGIVFKTPINTRGDIPTVPSVFPIGVSQ